MSESLYTVFGRQASRFAAVQALFQNEVDPVDVKKLISLYLSSSVNSLFEAGYHLVEMDSSHFSELVTMTVFHLEDLDQEISSVLSSNWSLERLDPVARAILRVAVAELRHFPLTPVPVVINEFVEISKGFLNKPDVSFIHASLDKIAKKTILKE